MSCIKDAHSIQKKYHKMMKKYWRIRTTNNCNARCIFCHSESANLKENNVFISKEYLNHFVNNYIKLEDHVAITGGEPLLHPEIIEIINIVCHTESQNIHMNTNALLLEKYTFLIKETNLKNIHINLASINTEVYEKIYGCRMIDLKIIDEASAYFNIRINCVILKSINDSLQNIKEMIEYSTIHGVELAFIENHFDSLNFKSNGLLFQNHFESILHGFNYTLLHVEAGRKIYSHNGHQIIIVAPCAPALAWNGNDNSDAFVVLENQTMKRFSIRGEVRI